MIVAVAMTLAMLILALLVWIVTQSDPKDSHPKHSDSHHS